MKTLEELTNTGKAKLLFDLFPEELPLFLEHLNNICIDLEERKEVLLKEWDNGFLSFHFWLALSNETLGILKRHKFNMMKSSTVFADQLFFSNTYMFVNDGIVKYAEHKNENNKFKIAVNLLYHP
ncbi:MAG: hypothetical protein P0Y49_13690 [Candidatus Pedobacter colombiensis]|uniref:Uncharacterized protein n=1 Tax=Candidatus Pedobacter colombiensis TaxID=3121371 RepID=A0AAJ6B5U0_9SPHI|nr:hypothetical protein [Pedobacter sp.]WEK17851.1 MAG: hypothetical protein P0Y49_13690 [Pedobacter sp.]